MTENEWNNLEFPCVLMTTGLEVHAGEDAWLTNLHNVSNTILDIDNMHRNGIRYPKISLALNRADAEAILEKVWSNEDHMRKCLCVSKGRVEKYIKHRVDEMVENIIQTNEAYKKAKAESEALKKARIERILDSPFVGLDEIPN